MTIVTGVPDSYLVPGHFLFVEYGGAFGPSGDQRHILAIGPKTADGTAAVNTVYDVRSDTHSDQLAGIGGPLAALCRAARVSYPTIPIKLCVTSDHVGGVAASGDITPTGTATSEGTLTVKVAGRTYTASIETGDTAIDICEKINLAINPTKLEMAKRLANELKADYNTHKASAVYHTVADPGNTVAAADATDLASLVTLANAIRTAYEAHRVLVGGGPCHGAADTANAISAAVCTDLATATVLLKDEKAKFEAHRINVSGAPPVHIASDVTDVISAYDPVDEQNPHLPVTSKVVIATPKVTLTAKFEGPDGNNIMVRCSTDAAGVTITEPTDNHLASGANQADYSSALAVALMNRHHYVAPVCNDAATLTAATVGLKARLQAAELALVGKRMQAVIGHNGAPTAGETLCDSFDYERMDTYSLECDTPPWEIAGAIAGLRCYKEGVDLSVNLAGEIVQGIVPPEDQADYPLDTDLDNALHQGLSLLTVDSSGQVRISYSITSRHTDGAGHADLSVWGTSKVTVGDALADTIVTAAALTYAGYKLQDNPTDPNTVIPEKTVTPDRFEEFLYGQVKDFEDEGHLTAGSVTGNKASIHAEINGSNPNRLDYEYPFRVVDHFLTSSGNGKQIG